MAYNQVYLITEKRMQFVIDKLCALAKSTDKSHELKTIVKINDTLMQSPFISPVMSINGLQILLDLFNEEQ